EWIAFTDHYMDYTTLSLAEVTSGLRDVMRDTQATFGHLGPAQLNWRPDEKRWSVAQCFEHLLTGNEMMLRAAREAMNAESVSVWQRLPFLPAFFGRALIRSQAPGAAGKYTAPAKATPTRSAIARDIIERFVEQQRDVVTWIETAYEGRMARANMRSPFI